MFRVTGECGAARAAVLSTSRGSLPTPCMLLTARSGDLHSLTPDTVGRMAHPPGVMIDPMDLYDPPKVPAEVDLTRVWLVQGLRYVYSQLRSMVIEVMERPGQLLDQPKPEGLLEYNKGIGTFLGLQNCCLIAIPRDPVAYAYGTKPNTKNSVYVMTHNGARMVTPEQYTNVIKAMKPDYYSSLPDEVAATSSRKRTKISVERTLQWLDRCISLHKDRGLECSLFAPITGGMYRDQRSRSAMESIKRDVAGFSLCGFATGETPEERPALLESALQHLPPEKPRLAVGLGSPDDVLEAVDSGVDVFDSGFVHEVSAGGYALSFAHCLQSDAKIDPDSGADDLKINMWAQEHRRDQRPPVEGCSCYCCKNHSRAYIHHLLQVHEMLAEILLHMHNVHHMGQFFDAIRSSIQEGKFADLKSKFSERRRQAMACDRGNV